MDTCPMCGDKAGTDRCGLGLLSRLQYLREKGITLGVGNLDEKTVINNLMKLREVVISMAVMDDSRTSFLSFHRTKPQSTIWRVINSNGYLQGYTYTDETEDFSSHIWSTYAEASFAQSLYAMLEL